MSEVVALSARTGKMNMRIGLLRLTDSAPVIVAHEFGFFAEHGIDTELVIEPSWANIADKLAYGLLDAAVIVPPLAFAVELGLRGAAQPLIVPYNVSHGGNTVTLARDLASRVRETAAREGLPSQNALALMLKDAKPPVLGVVHAYSTHNLLLRYWLASGGLEAGRDVKLAVVSPARAVEVLSSGGIAGFCAGAPWGEIAAREGVGVAVATSNDIWQGAPEKTFAVRARWAEESHDALMGALRALARAAQFCDAPENASYVGALLSRRKYVDADSHAILSSLPGGAIASTNVSRFWSGAASFPWTSHALWFLHEMARWGLIDGAVDRVALARRVYRPDLYRAAVAALGVAVPRADAKSEGAHDRAWQLDATPAPIAMAADRFCDGRIFHPTGLVAVHNN